MLKNLKHSILFILIVVMMLLIVGMSLAASKPVSQVGEKGISIPINPIINGKWSGLGIFILQYQDGTSFTNEEYDGWIDTLLANGFTEFREVPTYQRTERLAIGKAAIIRTVPKGAKHIFGVSSNSFDNPAYTITTENWTTFRQAILDAATWAQANGVFEFQLGNEEEYHVDGTTITVAQIITNLKAVATDVQAIFTRGNISYSCPQQYVNSWITVGKGDIDILAANEYMGESWETNGFDNDVWKTDITNLVNAFGANGTYLTEFSLSPISLDSYSTDESVQAAAIKEMIDYIRTSGMTRAIFFLWKHNATHWGVVKDDGTYRQLWNVLTGTDTIVPDTTEQTDETTQDTTLDITAPNITGLSNDTTITNSKIWTWGADEPATFRYLIDNKPDSIPTGDYSNTTTATQSGVNGTYYIHVQAKDNAGNESGVVTVGAIMKKVNNNKSK